MARAVAAFRAAAEERARQAELDRVRAEGERARLEAEARVSGKSGGRNWHCGRRARPAGGRRRGAG